MNEKMRRKDRETTEERAYEILKNGEYGILSTIGEDGYPYGVPVNFAVEGNKIISITLRIRVETEKC